MENAVRKIKEMIEGAIRTGGVKGKNNLIRSHKIINLIHNTVKEDLIKKGISPNRIVPSPGESKGELKLFGFLKPKDQDVCVLPNNLEPQEETLKSGLKLGRKCPYGKEYTEKTLTINVRSQLSSLAKNFDTLYERTFAEALNLHVRCPKMVLGEIYMIPVFEYDNSAAKENRVEFKPNSRVNRHLKKYINAFQALNNRNLKGNSEEFKYEKVCLLIVDFSKEVPKIYSTNQELINDGLISDCTNIDLNELNFNNFTNHLIKVYNYRFGKL
ncbi:restriction endonuclease [Natroniella sp. ANB-PHB2]|uniref:restriction endonuclease n=1 Tax=Natroniella sp. ANB-PHB2 TaxID=3384444 RepID=UPI0038D45FDB